MCQMCGRQPVSRTSRLVWPAKPQSHCSEHVQAMRQANRVERKRFEQGSQTSGDTSLSEGSQVRRTHGRLELLTGDVQIELSQEQTQSFAALFSELGPLDSMSEEGAKAKQEAILTILNDEQESRLVAIRLTRRAPDEKEDLNALNRLKERVGAKPTSDTE